MKNFLGLILIIITIGCTAQNATYKNVKAKQNILLQGRSIGISDSVVVLQNDTLKYRIMRPGVCQNQILNGGYFILLDSNGEKIYSNKLVFIIGKDYVLSSYEGYHLEPEFTFTVSNYYDIFIDEMGKGYQFIDGCWQLQGQLRVAIFNNPENLQSLSNCYYSNPNDTAGVTEGVVDDFANVKVQFCGLAEGTIKTIMNFIPLNQPMNGKTGDLYFDGNDNKFKYFDGVWKDLVTSSMFELDNDTNYVVLKDSTKKLLVDSIYFADGTYIYSDTGVVKTTGSQNIWGNKTFNDTIIFNINSNIASFIWNGDIAFSTFYTNMNIANLNHQITVSLSGTGHMIDSLYNDGIYSNLDKILFVSNTSPSQKVINIDTNVKLNTLPSLDWVTLNYKSQKSNTINNCVIKLYHRSTLVGYSNSAPIELTGNAFLYLQDSDIFLETGNTTFPLFHLNNNCNIRIYGYDTAEINELCFDNSGSSNNVINYYISDQVKMIPTFSNTSVNSIILPLERHSTIYINDSTNYQISLFDNTIIDILKSDGVANDTLYLPDITGVDGLEIKIKTNCVNNLGAAATVIIPVTGQYIYDTTMSENAEIFNPVGNFIWLKSKNNKWYIINF